MMKTETKKNEREKAMNTNRLNACYCELEAMTERFTKVICGQVVTRWSKNSFEIGTFGKAYTDIHKTAEHLAENAGWDGESVAES